MINRVSIPAPPLSRFVDCLWFSHDDDLPPGRERVLPSGAAQLIITLRDDPMRVFERERPDLWHSYRGAILSGASSRFTVIDTAARASTIGVAFKPGGAFPFFAIPVNELHDTDVALDALWGGAAGELREKLLAADTVDDKFTVLERYLMARIVRPPSRHPAVDFAVRELQRVPQTQTIAALTDRTGLSARRFIQVFNEQVGLTPKRFCRVRRFQAVLRSIRGGQDLDWVDVALACGYFDQAHFIHDFRAFSGLSPSDYVRQQGEYINHVALPD